jgi:hypothetical protein
MITIRYNCSTFAAAKTENELINHSIKIIYRKQSL